MRTENLKYMLQHGQENMTVRQIADAFKEAGDLIKRNEQLEKTLQELRLLEAENGEEWTNKALKIVHDTIKGSP